MPAPGNHLQSFRVVGVGRRNVFNLYRVAAHHSGIRGDLPDRQGIREPAQRFLTGPNGIRYLMLQQEPTDASRSKLVFIVAEGRCLQEVVGRAVPALEVPSAHASHQIPARLLVSVELAAVFADVCQVVERISVVQALEALVDVIELPRDELVDRALSRGWHLVVGRRRSRRSMQRLHERRQSSQLTRDVVSGGATPVRRPYRRQSRRNVIRRYGDISYSCEEQSKATADDRVEIFECDGPRVAVKPHANGSQRAPDLLGFYSLLGYGTRIHDVP